MKNEDSEQILKNFRDLENSLKFETILKKLGKFFAKVFEEKNVGENL